MARRNRPRTKELRLIYRKLLSVSIGHRLAALAEALHWWDNAIDFVNAKTNYTLGLEQKEKLLTAVKTRRLGLESDKVHERETALLKTLQLYEIVYPKLRPILVSEYYAKYQQRKGRMEASQARLEAKYGTVLKSLLGALQPKNYKGEEITITTGEGGQPRQYDPELRQLTFNRQHTKFLKSVARERGLLELLFLELPTFSRAAAIVPDGNGGYGYDPKKQIEATWQMHKSILAYCKQPDAPHKLVKFGVVQTTNGHQSRPAKADRVGGKYVPGRPRALLYQMLEDQQWHDREELRHVPGGVLRQLKDDGKLTGRWAIEQEGGKVRLVQTQV